LVTSAKRRFARKAERGTTVVVVVMVTTLITAIGIFAVRNVSQVDQAVGYSRQSAQTMALAELGTSAAIAQIGALGGQWYRDNMDRGYKCSANSTLVNALSSTCYRISQSEIESTTAAKSGETLTEPAVPGSEAGSFGPLSNMTGFVSIELTEKYKTSTPIAGSKQGEDSAFDVTLTATGNVRPITTGTDPCGNGVPTATVKKVMRAHVILPPN
jgi:hypothetical protein